MIQALKLFICITLVFAGPACTKAKPAKVAGSVSLAPALQQKIAPTATLYIVARSADKADSPPIAVKRIQPPFTFPIQFLLSAQDSMLPDAKFTGKIKITARFAQTGSATPANPGDLELSNPKVIDLDAQKADDQKEIELMIDHVRE